MVSIRFWTKYIDPEAILDPLNTMINQDIEGGVEVWTGKRWRPATKNAYDIVGWLYENDYYIESVGLHATKQFPWRGNYVAHYRKDPV